MDLNEHKVPVPYSREAEEAVIGSVLINPDAINLVSLVPEDFYLHRFRFVWEAFQSLIKQGLPIDFLTASEELDRRGTLEEIGGPAYLTGLISSVPTALNIEAYAKQVKDGAYRRKLIEDANALAKMAFDESKPADPTAIASGLHDGLVVDDGTKTIKDILWPAEDYLDELQARKDTILSPWGEFNRISGGIYKRQTSLIAGMPGLGKSVFVGQYGLYAAENGSRVSFYITEMDNEDMILRWASDRSGIKTQKIKDDDLIPMERDHLTETFEHIMSLQIRMTDSTSMSSAKIGADLAKHPADLVVVDSIGQLLERDEKKWDRVETSSMNLKRIAKDMDCAILAVATVVKDGSIRGTQEVQHICDYWYSLERPGGADDPDHDNYWKRKIFPSKQRHGGNKKYAELAMAENLPRLYVVGEIIE